MLSQNLRKIRNQEIEFKATDQDYPEIKDIKITGPRNFEIQFLVSRLILIIQKTKKIQIKSVDSDTRYAAYATLDKSNERVVSVRMGRDLNNTEYELYTFGFKDFAGYPSKTDSKTFFIMKRILLTPTVQVLDATAEYVMIKFSKPVKGVTLDNFYHTYRTWHPYEAYTNLKDMSLRKKIN